MFLLFVLLASMPQVLVLSFTRKTKQQSFVVLFRTVPTILSPSVGVAFIFLGCFFFLSLCGGDSFLFLLVPSGFYLESYMTFVCVFHSWLLRCPKVFHYLYEHRSLVVLLLNLLVLPSSLRLTLPAQVEDLLIRTSSS